jgi:P27 family predicted phage terminase small subunit
MTRPQGGGTRSRPTAVKRLHGVETRRINEDEPVPAQAGPVPPPDLTAGQRAVWDRLAEELGHMHLWFRADHDVIVAFCVWADRHHTANTAISKTGILVKDANGNPALNPLFKVASEAAHRMIVFGRELGLTPSARASLRAGLAAAGPEPERGTLADVRDLFG